MTEGGFTKGADRTCGRWGTAPSFIHPAVTYWMLGMCQNLDQALWEWNRQIACFHGSCCWMRSKHKPNTVDPWTTRSTLTCAGPRCMQILFVSFKHYSIPPSGLVECADAELQTGRVDWKRHMAFPPCRGSAPLTLQLLQGQLYLCPWIEDQPWCGRGIKNIELRMPVCGRGFTLTGKASSCCWNLDLKVKLEKREEGMYQAGGCSQRVKGRGSLQDGSRDVIEATQGSGFHLEWVFIIF